MQDEAKESGVPDTELGRSSRDLELYSECNEKMTRDFSSVEMIRYVF